MTEKQSIAIRAYAIYFLFLIGMIAVLAKTFAIQTSSEKRTDGAGIIAREAESRIPKRYVDKIPRMGDILDCNGISLVTSVSLFDIYMDPTVPKPEVFDDKITDLSEKLAQLFPDKTARQYENDIRRARARGHRYLLLKKKATNEQRRILRTFPIFELGRNKGGLIDNEENIQRKRPFGDMLKRTLGYYQNIEGKPELRVGIEGAYHEYLAGEPGQEVEQDRKSVV